MLKNKIGVIGDMHLKESLSYSDYVSDGRIEEKENILDFIVNSFEDCGTIVFLGDNLNSKNNSSGTIRELVEFIERFGDKEIFMLAGNHEKKGDGSTAIDFLKEVKKPNWHIITDLVSTHDDLTFMPNMLKSELEAETNEEALNCLLQITPTSGDILFTHYSITGTVFQGIRTDSLSEIVLPNKKLEERFKLIVAGHIHTPQQYGKVLIAGSVFTRDVNDIEKFIYKIKEDLSIEKIKVPAREIHSLENPTIEQLSSIPKSSIIKVILTNKEVDLVKITEELSKFDAHLLVEDYPSERKKMKIENGAMDFSIESLLKLYASEKGVDSEKLLKGLHIING